MTILIVEDNSILAKSISRRLRQCSYVTAMAASAAEARKALELQDVCALCLDIQLPDGNGLDILEASARRPGKDIPVVIISGSGTEADRNRAERNGALGFLIKPFALAELASIFEEALGRTGKTRRGNGPTSTAASLGSVK